jgi:predicted amidohydrolase
MHVTSIQLEIRDRPKAETLTHVLSMLDRSRGSDLILLPELWPSGYFSFSRYRDESEPVDGPLVEVLRRKARELGAFLFMGSLVERDGERLFNTSLLIDSSGAVIARYRKMHLFGYGSEEGRLLSRGEDVVVVPTPWGRAGLSICYDLRFPELYRRMVDQNADFFLIAAAWPAARREPWILLNRARALENQAFLFACNGAGRNGGVEIGGHSLLVDPLGTVLAEAADQEAILSIEVDPGMVARVRAEFPALQDRVLDRRRPP